jgi:hypothetical protein
MTGQDDLAQMEASLGAIAERNIDIVPLVFERFFAAFPGQQEIFYNPDASCPRMAGETLEALIGTAAGEPWVPTMITTFVDLHRNYDKISADDYARYVDLVVDTVATAAGADWTDDMARAWQAQAHRLNLLIAGEVGARG